MKYFVGICLMFSVLSCSEEISVQNNAVPEELSKDVSFSDWYDSAPKRSIKHDTLYSDPSPVPKDCESTLPNVECFYGHYFSESRPDGTNSQYYMINSYIIDSTEVLYLEVFNYEGRRVFSRSVFDCEFIKQENHFSRFYQNDRWFVFENCLRKIGEEEIVSIRKIDIYNMSEI